MNDKQAIQWANDKLKDPNAVTDGGCTFSPDFNFTDCCKRHDVMRNYNQGIDDKQADKLLRQCIKSKGHPVLAWVYWVAVRYESKIGSPLNAAALISVLYFISK